MNPNSHQPRGLAVITGATGGVGLEIAKGLARAGYDIIVGARSERRGTDAVTAIRSVATNSASIQQRPLDLASLASVAAFASALPDGPIDRLVLNAGVMLTRRKETEDGFEMMFGTNVLGHFRPGLTRPRPSARRPRASGHHPVIGKPSRRSPQP